MDLKVLAGIVETDLYYREVSFPALCLMRPGQRVRTGAAGRGFALSCDP